MPQDPGDTIEVHSGTYYENVDVNKQLILRGIDTGTGKPVVDAGGSGSAITLSADGITLEGFATTNSGSSWGDAGIKVTSNNNTITGCTASNNYWGICLDSSSSNNTITGNNATNNDYWGIVLYHSSNNNTITGNNASDNNYGTPSDNNYGIYLDYSSNNTITDNNANNNDYGIKLLHSSNNTITGNNANNNGYGIYLGPSCNNDTITDNNASNNNYGGISLSSSCNNNIITGNNASNNAGDGIYLDHSSNSTITGNNASNNDYGYGIYLKYSSNSTITGNNANNNDYVGIGIQKSNNVIITGNNASNNGDYGISIYSSNSTITGNNASNNNMYGIRLHSSCNNKIYLNNFINNTDNVYSYNSNNLWNSTEEISYTYNGSTYTNYTGNYWDDYIFEGNDTNGDGIGDVAYVIPNDNNDNYPLMEPWENYFVPVPLVFDTGSGTYPSIMGTHNGTIKPSHNINVSKLYTYPCVGTGGHTESIELYENDTLIANGSWNGYIGDYHNITLHNRTGEAPYVTLLKKHKYRYVIITGSYPQIIHAKSKNVTGGTITCNQFIDANGKIYTDWIPAIRLH